MTKKRKGESISLYLDYKINESLEIISENENSSKSDIVNTILKKYLHGKKNKDGFVGWILSGILLGGAVLAAWGGMIYESISNFLQ